MKQKTKKRLKWSGIIFAGLIVGLVIVAAIFINQATYQAMDEAQGLVEDEAVMKIDSGYLLEPDEVKANFVFYQGGLVETESYLPFVKALSEQGIRVFLPEFPLNLAILNADQCQTLYDAYPSDLPWWIGGHSLGGASATIFLSEEPNNIAGLLLLGAYPSDASDLSEVDYPVISIYAEHDEIMNKEAYQRTQALLPEATQFVEIEGGNHAHFGHYGFQTGDGESTISREQQQAQVIDTLVKAVTN